MDSLDNITTKSLKEKEYNEIKLSIRLAKFQDAYHDLLRSWELVGFDSGCLDYPFNKSFDELEIDKWCETFKSQLLEKVSSGNFTTK